MGEMLLMIGCFVLWSQFATGVPKSEIPEIYGFPGWYIPIDIYNDRSTKDYFENLKNPNGTECAQNVQCVISVEGEQDFFKNIPFLRLPLRVGRCRCLSRTFSLPFDSSWDGKLMNITLRHGHSHISASTKRIRVKSLLDEECKHSVKDRELRVGETGWIGCRLPTCLGRLSNKQMKALKISWYRNEEAVVVDNDMYEIVIKSDIFELKINRPSVFTTPGKYYCTITKNVTFKSKPFQVCVNNEVKNEPKIFAETEKIIAKPGDTAVLTCNGNTGTSRKSLSQFVTWKKNETQICRSWKSSCTCDDSFHLMKANASCEWTRQQGVKYCRPQMKNDFKLITTDGFNTSLTLHNVGIEDTGIYRCTFVNSGPHQSKTIRLVVQYEDNKRVVLIVILVIVSFLILVTILLLLILKVFRVEAKYYYKKYCLRFKSVERKYVAYLLYANDAYRDPSNNMVQGVMNFFQKQNYKWYDPNRCETVDGTEDTNAGALISQHIRDKLDDSECLAIIVTEELINDNKWTLFEAYEGFDNLIEKDLVVIFILAEGMAKEIKRKAKINNDIGETCATFLKLMELQKNRVVQWTDDEKYSHRSLYGAFPKFQGYTGPTHTTHTKC